MRTLFALMIAFTSLSIVAPVAQQPERVVDPSRLAGLEWCSLGPAGITFQSIFNDGHTLSIGAIAVQSDSPDVIYIGCGSRSAAARDARRRRNAT